MKNIRYALSSVLLLSFFNVCAQTDTSFLSRAVSSLENYSAANPVEKVHLHLDRTGYMPGDTVWFKAYTVAGQNHGLSAISNILNIELLTVSDSVINRIAIPLSNGVGWGDFALPVLIKTGSYHIRAYTNWMRNFAPDYFFDQSIQIKEIEAATTKQKKQKPTGEPDVQFFAEGGALVNSLRTKIAVKVIGTNGIGEDIDGSVIDNDGNEVAVFSTQHLGMGVFALIPQPGKTYKAKITRKNGDQFTARLPKAQDDGFAIAVNNTMPDSISIRVASSPKLFETKKGAKYYLAGQSGGKIYFTASLTLSSPSFSTRIDKKRFPTGVMQFTLFAENGEPLNERIIFIQHDDGLKLRVTSAKKAYRVRQKVDIKLNAADAINKPVVGSFSAAIINQDIDNVNELAENGILSNLLLTSDIKGNIEQPGYYFSNTNDKTSADLDLLMLTQGYHYFEWKKIFDKTPQGLIYEPESLLSVSGYLKTFGGKPIANGKLMLYSLKGGWFRLDTVTNQDGRFTFNGLKTDPDTTLKYVIQGRAANDKKNLNVTLDTIGAFVEGKRPAINYTMPDTTVQTAYQKQIKQQIKISLDKRIIPLKEVVIKEAAVRRMHDGVVARAVIKIPEDAIGQPSGVLFIFTGKRYPFYEWHSLQLQCNCAYGCRSRASSRHHNAGWASYRPCDIFNFNNRGH